jgi:hypothetical protein
MDIGSRVRIIDRSIINPMAGSRFNGVGVIVNKWITKQDPDFEVRFGSMRIWVPKGKLREVNY